MTNLIVEGITETICSALQNTPDDLREKEQAKKNLNQQKKEKKNNSVELIS
jgi:hypothetical protein